MLKYMTFGPFAVGEYFDHTIFSQRLCRRHGRFPMFGITIVMGVNGSARGDYLLIGYALKSYMEFANIDTILKRLLCDLQKPILYLHRAGVCADSLSKWRGVST